MTLVILIELSFTMDVKEIVALVKALNKASAAGEPPANIIDVLEKLRSNVVATEEILRVCSVY